MKQTKKDREFMEKARTINMNSHGRTELREPSPMKVITPENGDPRFQTIIPKGAADGRNQLEELEAKAKEDVNRRSRTTERKTYQLEEGPGKSLVGERID